ncbi:MAG TPA: DUF2789 domain-containing protein [Roseateles sp.]
MENSFHRFTELFAQLGLPSDAEAIGHFIVRHSPVPAGTRIEDAPFWTPAQAQLLAELIAQDADWAEVADQLNATLHRA